MALLNFSVTNGYDSEKLAQSLCFKATAIEKAVDYALADEEKTPVVAVTLTAASKVVTLGLDDKQTILIVNAGATNAFTLKNVDGDSGTSIAAGKVALIIASETANKSTITILN